jgi:hypothetical protein
MSYFNNSQQSRRNNRDTLMLDRKVPRKTTLDIRIFSDTAAFSKAKCF